MDDFDAVYTVVRSPNRNRSTESRGKSVMTFTLDDTTFQCHSNVIISDFPPEVLQQNITLKDIDKSAMRQIIDFFYGSDLVLTPENIEKIYAVAISLKITDIMRICWTITNGTHCLTAILRDNWYNTTVCIDALAAVFHFPSVRKAAQRQTPDVIKKFLTSPFLVIPDEDTLCRFLLDYQAKNPKSLETILLFEYIMAENLSSELCDQIFMQADKRIVTILAKRRFRALEIYEETKNRYQKRDQYDCYKALLVRAR